MNLLPTNPLSGSTEPLKFTPDERAVFLRELGELIMGYTTLHQIASAGKPLERGLTRNILYLGEARNAELCKLSGIETDGTAEREQRFAKIRELNVRNRELERQLGCSGTTEQTAAHLKVLAEKLNKWWDQEGFGHISTLNFTQSGALDAEFSCHLLGTFQRTGSATPVSDKSSRELWFESLTQKGFRLEVVPGERDPVVVDCDTNRQALATLFTEAFASSEVVEVSGHNVRTGMMALRSVRVYIRELAEVDALGMRPKDDPVETQSSVNQDDQAPRF